MDEADKVAEVQNGEITEGFVCKEYDFMIYVDMFKEPEESLENIYDVVDGWSEDMDSALLMSKVRGQKENAG